MTSFSTCYFSSSSSSSSSCFQYERFVSYQRNPFSNLSFPSTSKTRPGSLACSAPKIRKCISASSSQSYDVIVIGAGVIGLTIARQILLDSDLSVVVVDKAVPCSGATGAGQGYLWMAHKTPGSDLWDLALRSQKLWRVFAESLSEKGLDPQHLLGWRNTGSLLIGRTPEESDVLKKRVKMLSDAGVRSEYLSPADLIAKEPALMVQQDFSGAAFFPDDCQIDARRTVDVVLEDNRKFSAKGRYVELFNDPVTYLLRSGSNGNGEVVGVGTANKNLYGKAIIVAAGCWSGSLTRDLFRESEIVLDVPVRPRKGHLLVLKNFDHVPLNHALMEAGYVDHQSSSRFSSSSTPEASDQDQSLSISMTATMDSMGNLVLGSSRQFSGFGTEVEETVIDRIWERAKDFFPKLREQKLSDFITRREVRVGLRPYMADGKPMIGRVPGLSNVLLATGHEGGGLSMALGTAEMVVDMVLGNPEKADLAPFSVQGRG